MSHSKVPLDTPELVLSVYGVVFVPQLSAN